MELDNRRTDQSYNLLADRILEASRGKPIVYARNWGNWGDGLIHQGTEQFLEEREIAHVTLSQPRIDSVREALEGSNMSTSGTVLLAGGSGGWCEPWTRSRDFIQRNEFLFDHIVVLPTTYQLPHLDIDSNRITYFRRDEFGSRENSPESEFCHDMAFYLELKGLDSPDASGEGYFFREDAERSHDSRVFPNSIDLSALNYETKAIRPFFQILASFRVIHTDRLHVAIAACLMGLRVVLYPGVYSKSLDIYQSSILGRYPNLKFEQW